MTNEQLLNALIDSPVPPISEYVNDALPIPQPLNLTEEHVPRFEPDDPAMVTYLGQHGFVIVKNVASKTEIGEAQELLWRFLEKACGMKQHDHNTWSDENMNRIGSTRNGIMNERGINHSEFLWYIRMLPKVKAAFAAIHGTDALLTSFDGGNVFRPWHVPLKDSKSEFAKTRSGWFHVDQGRKLQGLQCVQGIVTLTDVNARTGGFCCIPGSHRDHHKLMQVTGHDGANFALVPGDFPALNNKQIIPICAAGDLILWDSRCIHANTPALEDPVISDPPQLLRIAAYVCMSPRSLATDAVIANKIRLFERGYGTGHWPHLMNFEVPEGQSGVIVNHLDKVSAAQRSLIIGETCD